MSNHNAAADRDVDADYRLSDSAIILFNITMLLDDHVGEPWYRELVRRERDGEVDENDIIDICCDYMGLTRDWLLRGRG